MFVSGPTGTSVTGSAEPRMRSARKSTACWATGRALRLGERGPVEAGFPVHVGGDEELAGERAGRRRRRPGRRPGRRARARGGRSRSSSSSVWLPGDGRDAEKVELGAREREQKRDRVVVARVAVEQDRRASRTAVSISSTSAAVGSDGLRARAATRRSRRGARAPERLRPARGPRAGRRRGRR